MAEIVTTVGGIEYLLGDLGHVGDLEWSHGWPYGCLEASWSMVLPRANFPRALSPNAMVEIWDGPKRVWSGFLTEPQPGEVWSLHAKGWYAAFANRLCLTADESTTSAVPNVFVPAAIARGAGLPITVGSTLSGTSMTSASETVSTNTVAAALDAHATDLGQRWMVDADRVLWLLSDPTTVTYVRDSGEALRGTADDDYVTDVYPRFVSSLDGTTGEPNGWGLGHVSSTSTPAGRRERAMDVTERGLMLESAAESLAQAQLDLNSARMGYTNGFEVAAGELLRPGGSPARLGLVAAREIVRELSVADAAGQVQLGLTEDVLIGKTQYRDGSSTLALTPVGLAPRTFVDTLRALQPKETFDGTAA